MPEPLETSTSDRPPVSKLWGWEEWIVNNEKFCLKRLHLLPGYRCSLHYHPVKSEAFLAVEGTVLVEYGEAPRRMTVLRSWAGDCIYLPAGTPHRFAALDGPAVLVEASTHHDDADTVRIEPSEAFEL